MLSWFKNAGGSSSSKQSSDGTPVITFSAFPEYGSAQQAAAQSLQRQQQAMLQSQLAAQFQGGGGGRPPFGQLSSSLDAANSTFLNPQFTSTPSYSSSPRPTPSHLASALRPPTAYSRGIRADSLLSSSPVPSSPLTLALPSSTPLPGGVVPGSWSSPFAGGAAPALPLLPIFIVPDDDFDPDKPKLQPPTEPPPELEDDADDDWDAKESSLWDDDTTASERTGRSGKQQHFGATQQEDQQPSRVLGDESRRQFLIYHGDSERKGVPPPLFGGIHQALVSHDESKATAAAAVSASPKLLPTSSPSHEAPAFPFAASLPPSSGPLASTPFDKSSPAAHASKASARVGNPQTPSGGVAANPLPPPAPSMPVAKAGTEHWMPDKLCKLCYHCEVQFTVFKRRHHCRLCGQVFCSACSSYFVELAADANPASSRQLSTDSQSSSSTQLASSSRSLDFRHESVDASAAPSASSSSKGGAPPASKTVRACKMCFDQVIAAEKSTLGGPMGGGQGSRGRRRQGEDVGIFWDED